MRFRLPLLTAAVATSLALPGAAQAAAPGPISVPCVDAIVVTVNCAPQPAPAPQPQPQPQPAQACPGSDLRPNAANLVAVRNATHCLINKERTSRGLRSLKQIGTLRSVANSFAKRMVRERFFAHTSPDGGTFLSRIKRTSYLRGNLRRWLVGENLAWGSGELGTPERIVRSWMGSPAHRRNILTPRFTEHGLGIALGSPKGGTSDANGATYADEFGERRR